MPRACSDDFHSAGAYVMLNEAEKRDRGFDVIVLRDVDRLGGGTNRNW
jgi:hypothetical protein